MLYGGSFFLIQLSIFVSTEATHVCSYINIIHQDGKSVCPGLHEHDPGIRFTAVTPKHGVVQSVKVKTHSEQRYEKLRYSLGT